MSAISNRRVNNVKVWLIIILGWTLILSGCQPAGALSSSGGLTSEDIDAAAASQNEADTPALGPIPTLPTRPRYEPGQLVDYTAMAGDTLPGLAKRFNTSVEEILEANDFIPASATTMPPGMPMQIPIYYMPLWGSPYKIIPDSLFVNGPQQIGFDTHEFVNMHTGWLKSYSDFVSGANRSGAEIVDLVAHYYSVSPRLLLALLEYQSGALTEPEPSPEAMEYPMGYKHWSRKRLYLQLTWGANLLNNGYYSYKTMALEHLEYEDGRIEYFDPWLNPASASLQNFFNTLFGYEQYLLAITPDGFVKTYHDLFGNPWETEQPHIPGSLEQPSFILPFQPGDVWALTGGPHSAWGKGEPLAALDLAPPSKTSGCVPSAVWATAVSPGVVVRSTVGEVMLDLDGDGDERSGWNVFYLHVASDHRVSLGANLEQGDPIGHPSCEGGSSTGTHIHIARKFNGEWIPAEGWGGVMAFNMEGWIAHNGDEVYLGTMTRGSRTVISCTCSNAASFIQTDRQPELISEEVAE